MKVTQKTLTAKISEKTGLNTYRSKKALQTALDCIKQALGMGKTVDMDALGRLVVVHRRAARRIVNKLNGQRSKTVRDVHERHPKTVRLLGGRDLSPDPKPVVVHKQEPEPKPIRKSFAIAYPSWRRRTR
jgi:nucleoid DNA-binding protein